MYGDALDILRIPRSFYTFLADEVIVLPSRGCSSRFLMLIALLTIVWGLFLTASVVLSLLLVPLITFPFGSLGVAILRVGAGAVAFALWVFVWEKLTEFWLYHIMMGERKS